MRIVVVVAGLLVLVSSMSAQEKPRSAGPSTAAAPFKVPAMWECTAPLITPEKRDKDPSISQKDPTVVYYQGKWHVFMTVKVPGMTATEYCSFGQWEDADKAPRTILMERAPRSAAPRERPQRAFTIRMTSSIALTVPASSEPPTSSASRVWSVGSKDGSLMLSTTPTSPRPAPGYCPSTFSSTLS